MASLTGCVKKAGDALRSEDRGAIFAKARTLRGSGLDASEAAKQAVQAQLDAVRGLIGERALILSRVSRTIARQI